MSTVLANKICLNQLFAYGKIATYFKCVQVHNVSILECVTLQTCLRFVIVVFPDHTHLLFLHAQRGPYFRYMSCYGSIETA